MTNCLILAAGEGTRLRPITIDRPKGLVSFLGKPLVSHQIEILKASGIEDIAIATGYRADDFNSLGCKTYHNKNYSCTNMVESLFAARSYFEQASSDICISYGDIVYEQRNLQKVLETEGVVKGQTAASSYKPATLERNIKTSVPQFIATNDKIVISTIDGSYIEKSKN